MAVFYGADWASKWATAGTSTQIWPVWTDNTTISLTTPTYEQSSWYSTNSADITFRLQQWPADDWAYHGSVYTVQATPAEPVLTPEQLDQRLRDTRARQRKQEIIRKRAVRKGRRLLLSMLNDLQRHQYAKHGQFTVHGADGKIYILRKSGTVHELDSNGRAAWSHCIHLPYSYIDEDTLIAQKLMLETDPGQFRKIANTNKIYVPDVPAVTAMAERVELVRSGPERVADHLTSLWNVAARERYLQDRIARSAEYAEYARQLEAEVVAEEHRLAIPNLSARQQAVSRALGHAETIGGELIAA